MDLLSVDIDEISLDEESAINFVPDLNDDDNDDDYFDNTEEKPIFAEELIKEVEQTNKIIIEDDVAPPNDDDEKMDIDRSTEENELSDNQQKSSTPISSVQNVGRGRGRKKLLDQFNQPLPSFTIDDKVRSDSGFEENESVDNQQRSSTTTTPVQSVGRGRGRRTPLNQLNQPLSSLTDGDKVRSDSGFEENEPSNIQQRSSVTTTSDSIVGRGRYDKIATDEHDQPLPPPTIRIVEPEKGFYSEPARKARLPASYYRKREDPETQKQRLALRQSSALLDFTAEFNQISFIIDRDDSKEKGYQHACRRFHEIQTNIKIDSSKPHHDLWHFGLYTYPTVLSESTKCNLLELIPQQINNEENRPYWFMFKNLPKFQDQVLRNGRPKTPETRKDVSKQSEMPKRTMTYINRAIYAELSQGALTSLSHYHLHKDYIIRKRMRWALVFHEECFEIQTIISDGIKSDASANLKQIRYKIPLDIIDRVAVIRLSHDGFSLFLNMKGNIHELYRDYKKRNKDADDDEPREPFIRKGMPAYKPMPLFSTVRIRIQIKDDDGIHDILEREGKISKNTSADEKDSLMKTMRDEALDQIRDLFKNFLDLFSNNRIHICFGFVSARTASSDQLSTLDNQIFPTFIQSYSWTMLSKMNFRLRIQLYRSKTFIQKLHDYSKFRFDENNNSQVDDRFYRLCLYIHRRSSEYFFLDLDEEVEVPIKDFDEKYNWMKRKKLEMTSFNQITTSTAYIPSVIITPTTIQIRPLKLCKLNRVLRGKCFGNVLNFALIELRDEAQRALFPTTFRSLKKQILHFLTHGFPLTSERTYKYLHHSQSQVKCKQFWFYYHDKEHGCVSHEDAYVWMGNFDKERVVAKHAARIALCFTSTDSTIQIPAEKVTYVRDIKDKTKKYTFSDGVGVISTRLRDQIKEFLGRHYEFSVLQIRYGGCKGTLSVDPRLDGQQYELIIRDSMNKFTSDHDILELCKLSAPRALYLNRQDIILLESRDILHVNFLALQNDDHLRLINALLKPESAYQLLQDKLLPVFRLNEIAQNLDIVTEQFFMKLIITCSFNIMRELIDRTRIRISNETARNMFGILDEYSVLESGQVFIQYSSMYEKKLENEETEEEKDYRPKVLTGKVVITKNPCHHPGDLRVFDAVDREELRHLKDVIVFPQKGSRPHSNEISGSDLDGDEYAIIWHEDLIPKTPNEIPYDYDSQEDPQKMDRPITREDINKIVMEVSEQDSLGTLSNLHLAFADKQGIKSKTCIDLAGAISQEVDAAKTGKHPLNEEQIRDYRDRLENQWPDFMKARGKKGYYPSERILGKLYRSARRAVLGWSRAIKNHGNPHHIQLALALTSGKDIKDQVHDEINEKPNILTCYQYPLDPYIYHDGYEKHLPNIKILYKMYQTELLEIISLYRFQDEIDLFCRSESVDASGGANKKGGLEDSAALEIQNLVDKVRRSFSHEFDERARIHRCCKFIPKTTRYGTRLTRLDCDYCHEEKFAKAACAYIYTYQRNNRLPLKSNRRILSFPWLFSSLIIQLRMHNQRIHNVINQKNTIVGRACLEYLKNLTPKFKVSILEKTTDIEIEFFYRTTNEKRTSLLPINQKQDEKISFVPLLRACFIEILNDWLIKQEVFGHTCTETEGKPLIPESIWHELVISFLSCEERTNVRLISVSNNQPYLIKEYRETIENYCIEWEKAEYKKLQEMSEELHKMFEVIHSIAIRKAKATELTVWTYLDEYILLALQCIAIERKLVDTWIHSPSS